MKLYIVGPTDGEQGVYSLIAETGEGLASHYCSHSGYASGDLEERRPERQEKWKKKFGDYQVLFLGQDEMTEERLLELNKQWYKANPKAEAMPEPKVIIEVSE